MSSDNHVPGPSGAPVFRRSKITTLSTGLDIYWDPPPINTINGEFLGYILTYRPAERLDKKVIQVRDESLKTQVRFDRLSWTELIYLGSCATHPLPLSVHESIITATHLAGFIK